jgi:predicted Zn finger-like uncharacterized protein
MPFAVTCPKCGAAFRSAAERPIGKGVQCPRCGEQFYVSPENQAEVRPGPPPAPKRRSLDDEDDTPRRRPRNDEDDDRPVRSRSRDQDDRDEDAPRPRRQGRGRSKVVALLAVVAVGLLAAVAAGAYFLFVRGSGGPSTAVAGRIPPQKDLPVDLLAYAPDIRPNLTYYDLAALRPAYRPSDARAKRFAEYLPSAAGVSLADVDAYCAMHEGVPANALLVLAVRLTKPRPVEEIARRCLLSGPVDVGGVPVYQGPLQGGGDGLFFQPAPTQFVYVRWPRGRSVDPKVVSDLTHRDRSKPPVADDIADALRRVSGYPVITVGDARTNAPGLYRATVSGRGPSAAGEVEFFRVRPYDSDADATERMKREQGKVPARAKDYETWRDGRFVYEFMVDREPLD